MHFLKSKFLLSLVLFSSFLNLAYGLPVDEKLGLRILKLSESKKTMLINRGIEDGLEKEDHAKFYITEGVVARGVLIRLSPARSVWSLYRLVNRNELQDGRVINLKITPKFKLTDDPTKALNKKDPVYDKRQDIATLTSEQGARIDDGSANVGISEKELPESDGIEVRKSKGTWEVWGIAHLSFLSSTNSTGAEDTGTSGSHKVLDFTAAVEKYFDAPNSWYGDFSLYPFVHYYSQEGIAVEGSSIGTQFFGYGLGVNYHFLNPPLSTEKVIGHIGVSAGIGSVTDTTNLIDTGGNEQSANKTGSANFFTLGVGLKYNLRWGGGFKILLDYYRRGESYEVEGVTDPQTKVTQGPRILVGLNYRF